MKRTKASPGNGKLIKHLCDYQNFKPVFGKTRLSCINSGHRIEDHFVDITKMDSK
jgi:hypothetical protein